jgi:hypothetical protein
MEERTIRISIDTAREWYKIGNDSLRKIALQAFTKEELEQVSIKEIVNHLLEKPIGYNLTETQQIQLESIKRRNDYNRISSPKLLRILATYFNGEFWKKKEGDVGYFFYKKEPGFMTTCGNNILDKQWCISSHTSVCYPTLVYFKKEKDCKKAYNIMKSLGKLDALYTDF